MSDKIFLGAILSNDKNYYIPEFTRFFFAGSSLRNDLSKETLSNNNVLYTNDFIVNAEEKTVIIAGGSSTTSPQIIKQHYSTQVGRTHSDVIWSFSGHNNIVYSILLDSEGYLYSSGYDEAVRKSFEGSQLWVFTSPTAKIEQIVFSNDGNIIANAGNSGLYKINKENGKQIWHNNTEASSFLKQGVGAWGGNIYCISSDRRAINVLNSDTGEFIKTIAETNSNISNLVIKNDFLYFSFEGEIHKIDLVSEDTIWIHYLIVTLSSQTPSELSVSDDGFVYFTINGFSLSGRQTTAMNSRSHLMRLNSDGKIFTWDAEGWFWNLEFSSGVNSEGSRRIKTSTTGNLFWSLSRQVKEYNFETFKDEDAKTYNKFKQSDNFVRVY
ncbi:outer membrane protein assembly factor BamB family protein [Maledivibacter halophilus]|uniref:PQQ-like domain-containing protein n=1 Tax=Maledivibacter halophilus TaxID=36842 RepID=A0A1T5K6B2_9FIRM|nr:PQQ-binding-like beta-propeller repeat protein [Maledivibacter halophilus]SKC59282.1 PQQ-like domain-containing protein [Maledivibacter halophilus]